MGLSLGVVGLFYLQNKQSAVENVNFQSYQHQNKVSKKAIATVNEPESIKVIPSKVNREIAQRKPLPNDGRGPRPLRLRRVKKEPINSQKNAYDIKINGITLKHNFYAIKNDQDIPEDYKLIEEKLGFYIVETNLTPKDGLSIVTTEDSEEYAIFTGILKIKFKNILDSGDILSEYNGRVSEDYSHIKTILFQFDQFEETMQAFSELQNNPGVERVSVELLQYQRSSK